MGHTDNIKHLTDTVISMRNCNLQGKENRGTKNRAQTDTEKQENIFRQDKERVAMKNERKKYP